MAAVTNTRDVILRVASPRSISDVYQSQIDILNNTLDDIASDTKITAAERQALRKEWDQIIAKYVDNSTSGLAYLDNLYPAVTTHYTAYQSALQTLATYLNNGSAYTLPSLGSSPTDAPNWISNANIASTTAQTIVSTTFRNNWKAVYAAETLLVNKAADEAGKVAGWTGVTGTGKPADYATADIALVNVNGCTITGNNVVKTGGTNNTWDASVRTNYGYNGCAYVEATVTLVCNAMIGFNTSASSSSNYTEIYYAFYITNTSNQIQIYHLGNLIASPSATYSVGDRIAVLIEDYIVKFFLNGSVIYSMPRAPAYNETWYLDTTFYQTNAGFGNIKFSQVTSNTKSTNLVDTSGWVVGTTNSQSGGWTAITGSYGTNSIRMNTGPDGSEVKTWIAQMVGTTASQLGGGSDPGPILSVDPTKKYRLSVWILKSGTSDNTGAIYLGTEPSKTNYLTGDAGAGTTATNPYTTIVTRSSLTYGKWYLMVGYIHQHDTSITVTTNQGGVFSAETGEEVAGSSKTDLRWKSTTISNFIRILQYGVTTNGAAFDFFSPRLEVCDGTEPSIAQLLATGAVSGRNKITSNTTNNFMSSGAVSVASGSDWAWGSPSFGAGGSSPVNNHNTGDVNVVNLTTTGTPVKFWGQIETNILVNNTTVQRIHLVITVKVDGTSMDNYDLYLPTFIITGGVIAKMNIPFSWRGTLSAANHNFQVRIAGEWLNSSNSLVSSYGDMGMTIYGIVEENKV